jgi:hypothetical protein
MPETGFDLGFVVVFGFLALDAGLLIRWRTWP